MPEIPVRVPVIDSHHHFWEIDRFDYSWMPEGSPLATDYGPEELKPLMANAGVDYTVIVQAVSSPDEARWLLELAEDNEFIAGVVGWVDLTDPEVGHTLDELQQSKCFVGVRHIWESEEDPGWIVNSGAINGLKELARRDLAFDFLAKPANLPYIPQVMDQVPDLRAVVDHIAKPLIADHVVEPWLTDLRKVASINGVHCKVSGMITEADHQNWTVDDLRPYVHHVLGMFGSDRLMFGTDWPVCTLAGGYEQVVDTAREILGSLSPAAKADVFGGTAARFYRLDIQG
ncbi:MAG: amidohydrolase family protein [Chloroflexi bacterium]|nr:amidohydrolase family protein [Chloroflexota bacterium]MCH8114004.1 amidohydrolase family protein [Chloroflexota bacterium]MCI0803381.1 amidohydrolase family protein [Chloroflexota bacterium]MCI0807882.1 amidohydrolase family protein [Chloroflexota bacterium]MCI0833272.1 amidohydrolase family protein [Chloroflexota bacterium]